MWPSCAALYNGLAALASVREILPTLVFVDFDFLGVAAPAFRDSFFFFRAFFTFLNSPSPATPAAMMGLRDTFHVIAVVRIVMTGTASVMVIVPQGAFNDRPDDPRPPVKSGCRQAHHTAENRDEPRLSLSFMMTGIGLAMMIGMIHG